MKNKITIAIDGFSSCGKSTMAKELAKSLGYIYVDSGAMYRAITLYALRNGIISDSGEIDLERLEGEMDNIEISFKFNSETQRPDTYLNGVLVEGDIRLMEVSNSVSHIAAIGFVRKALVEMQQAMGKEKGIVMDGRDIGTVVFPDAELKIYVIASAQVRAQRRYDELTAKGEVVNFDEILANVVERDNIDMNRQESPLRQADDALVLDNSDVTIEQQNRWLIEQVERLTKA